jgi:carbamoyl-phosphate synthase large subunit
VRLNEIRTVLVPSSAAPAGINAIKSLKIAGFEGNIIATDADPLSAGFFLASRYEVVPKSEDEEPFINRLFEIIRLNKVQVLLPTSQKDTYVYSKYRREIEELGANPVTSDTRTIEACVDKILTFQLLIEKFNLPFTTANPDKISKFPVIAKPRFGRGSRNVFKINNEADLQYITSNFEDMIFQDYLPGTEYTIDVLSDLRENPLIAVPRVRIETKAGISTKGRTVHMPDLEQECMAIAKSLGIQGPCCIQMKESEEGTLKLVEVNPRLGGGTIITTLAGANFPAMILDMAEGKKLRIPEFSEITVIRYLEEIVVSKEHAIKETHDLAAKMAPH